MPNGKDNGQSRLVSVRMKRDLLARLDRRAVEVRLPYQSLLQGVLSWALDEWDAGRGPDPKELLTMFLPSKGRPKGSTKKALPDLMMSKPGKGEVYFVQAGEGGPIKIGWSTDVSRRMAGLRPGTSAPLKLLLVVPGTRASEKAAHDKFKAYRLHGEWFKPDPRLLAAIEQIRVAMEEKRAKKGGP